MVWAIGFAYTNKKTKNTKDMTREDLDYEELLRNYGNEYLQEYDPDDCLYAMDEMDELFNESAYNAIQRAFYGYDYNPHREGDGGERESFNPNRDWFGFNGYANLVSVDDYDYVAWMDSRIDDDNFIEWCMEQGYVDEDEDIEGCKGIGGSRDRFVIAKVYNTRYRNTSYYGNPSYYVTLELENGELWHCYTAPDVSLGYAIENPDLKNEWHKFMYRDGARGCALHWAEKI